MDGGPTPEFKLYMTRSETVYRAVIGPEFLELLDEAEQIAQDNKMKAIEAFYNRAFDLLHDACIRVQQQPGEYERLVEWKNEVTLHGTGHPNLKDALFDAYHELWQSIRWPSREEIGATEAEAFEGHLKQRSDDLWILLTRLPK